MGVCNEQTFNTKFEALVVNDGEITNVLGMFSDGGNVEEPEKNDYIADLTTQQTTLANTLQKVGVEVDEKEVFSTLIPKNEQLVEELSVYIGIEEQLAELSDGGGVENPTTDDYVNDLINRRNSLAETLQEAGVEASPDETFSTLVPKNNEKIKEMAVSAGVIDALTNYGERENCEGLFRGCTLVTELPPIAMSKATNLYYAFQNCSSLTKVTFKGTPPAPTGCREMFQCCLSLTEIPNIDFSKVETLQGAFDRCISLPKHITFNAYDCRNLQTAFQGVPCEELTVIISDKCTSLYGLCASYFEYMGAKHLTIIGDTSNATFANIFFKSDAISLYGDNLVFGKNSQCGSMWMYWCGNFKNITPKRIETNFYMAHTGVLTLESAKNIINALVDYSGTDEEFAYEVTFHPNTLALLEAEGATAPNGLTWLEYADSKGWNT